MIETDVPRSPGWWLKTLGRELQNRRHGRGPGGAVWQRGAAKPQEIRPGLDRLHGYLMGEPPLPAAANGWQEHFREACRMGRLNVAALITEAKSNRMKLRDFRTAAPNDLQGDEAARRIMRANDMRVVARDVHDGFLSLGDSYAMVTPGAASGDIPLVTFEDAREVITAHDPATGRALAGLKMFRDEWDSADFAYLFVREGANVNQYNAAKTSGRTSLGATAFQLGSTWGWSETDFGKPVPARRMPIVRFRNYRGVGEYELHLDTLDRINDQILDRLVIAKVQAFRQRAIKGLPDTQKKRGEDGRIVEVPADYTGVFDSAPGALWRVPEGVDFWESQTVDFGPIRMAIKDDLEHLAAVTSTSLHTITPDAASGSAEGASLMRETSVDAAQTRIDHADRSWAEVMSICFAFMGDEARADVTQIDPIWGPVERYSLSEKADAASKAGTSLPTEAIQTDIWQYPPAEVANLRQMSARDLIFRTPAAVNDADPTA